jgi:hypothetical protein
MVPNKNFCEKSIEAKDSNKRFVPGKKNFRCLRSFPPFGKQRSDSFPIREPENLILMGIGPDWIPFWPRPLSHAPKPKPLPPRLQRPSWISGTAAPTDSIRGSFDGVFRGEYGKIIGEPSFITVPDIRTIQCLFMQIHTLPVVWPRASSYWRIFRVDQMCLSTGMIHTTW